MELQALKLYLMSIHGVDRIDQLFWEIQMIILRSLLAVQPIMIADKHCFELYGYDIIIGKHSIANCTSFTCKNVPIMVIIIKK